ncbi:MAG: hypothetical protein GY749_10565 [Desulfobacteraceae bacterium]|nr:hypothetical protein [Desulfobacteraceae bacterium]
MKKNVCKISCLTSFLTIIILPNISHAGQNASAGCILDMDIATHSYEQVISSTDIESNTRAYTDDIISVAIVAQNVSNIDTYQAEVMYDPTVLQYIEAWEDAPMHGIKNVLKTRGGTSIGFQAVERKAGVVNIANTLTRADISEAPEGSGVLAVMRFKVLTGDSTELGLRNVCFVDSFQNRDFITIKKHGNIN